ncbi:hypothetical protein WG901_13865 [Novosphingobium sp. PS1R-30]|uniref:Uncharacterized protein n=1 Tax=Novosphingobium anseongense TaxID=3133436 RepID=A0ABU8RXB1_9SPHN
MANQHETISRADCLAAAVAFLSQTKLTEHFAQTDWARKVATDIDELTQALHAIVKDS